MRVFDSSADHDIAIGRDWLRAMQFELDFNQNAMTWMENTVNMKERQHCDTQQNCIDIVEEDVFTFVTVIFRNHSYEGSHFKS